MRRDRLDQPGAGAEAEILRDPRLWWPIVQLSALFVLVQSTRFFVDVGDDGLHYYAARLVAEGHAPYRDFFYGSAVGPALCIGALLGVGAPIWVTKLLPLAGVIGAASCTALVVRLGARRSVAIAAAAIVLGGDYALRLGMYQGGHWVPGGLVMGALLAGHLRRWTVAGALLSAATLYDLHGALGIVIVGAMAARAGDLRQLIKGLAGLALGWLALWLWCGDAFFEQTLYYGSVVADGERVAPWQRTFAIFVRRDPAVIALALAAALDKRGVGRWVGAVAAAGLVVLLAWPRTSSVVVAFGPLAAAAGFGIEQLLRMGEAHEGWRRRVPAVVVALLLISTVLPHALSGLARHRGKHIANQRIASFSRMVRQRIPRSKRIWGDSAVVPTLAFRAGVRIPANEFDTNERRLRTGMLTPEELIDRALSEGPPAVILVRRHGVWLARDVRAMAWSAMKLDFVFRGGVGYRALYFLPPVDYNYYLRLGESALFDTPELHIPDYVRKAMRKERRDREKAENSGKSRDLARPATATME